MWKLLSHGGATFEQPFIPFVQTVHFFWQKFLPLKMIQNDFQRDHINYVIIFNHDPDSFEFDK